MAHKVFVGYDPSQQIAYDVLEYSILKHASEPVEVIAIDAEKIEGWNRELDPLQSTPFTYTRFLVPYLMGYEGIGLFIDSDMLALDDITPVFHLPMEGLALRVRKHEYNPSETVKMGGKVQTTYPRKNWSSMMLMNTPELKLWNLESVSTWTGKQLHRFEGVPDEAIGDIPEEYNVLDHMTGPTRLLHYTSGGPWLKGCEDCDHNELWQQYREEYERSLASAK